MVFMMKFSQVVDRPRTSYQELATREDEGSMHDWARAAFGVVMANGYDLLTPGGGHALKTYREAIHEKSSW